MPLMGNILYLLWEEEPGLLKHSVPFRVVSWDITSCFWFVIHTVIQLNHAVVCLEADWGPVVQIATFTLIQMNRTKWAIAQESHRTKLAKCEHALNLLWKQIQCVTVRRYEFPTASKPIWFLSWSCKNKLTQLQFLYWVKSGSVCRSHRETWY